MKLTDYGILFVILMSTVVIRIDHRIDNLGAVTNLQVLYNQRVEAAVDDGVVYLTEFDNNEEVFINKDACVANFYNSLFANFYATHDQDLQNQLKVHIPVLAIIEMDGYYIQSLGIAKKNGVQQLVENWSSKAYFYYEEEDLLYQFFLGSSKEYLRVKDLRRNLSLEGYRGDLTAELPFNKIIKDETIFDQIRRRTIIESFSETLVKSIKSHNQIANKLGINYEFAFPSISWEEWYRTVDDIGFFVFFQGYPYGNGTGDTYNRFLFSGVRNYKKAKYYVEEKSHKLWYHNEDCPELINRQWIYSNQKLCAKAGAYPCPACQL